VPVCSIHASALISAARLAGLIVLDDQISGCALGT
jgi:hypothetical protein